MRCLYPYIQKTRFIDIPQAWAVRCCRLFSGMRKRGLYLFAAVSRVEPRTGLADALLILDRPITKRLHRHQQIASQISQLIIHARWNGWVDRSSDKTIAFETTQRARQHLLRDAIDRPFQLIEPHRSVAKIFDDHHRPFVTDARQKMMNRGACGSYLKVIWFQKSASLRPFRTVTYIAPVTNSYHPPR